MTAGIAGRRLAVVPDVANVLADTEGSERRLERALDLVRAALPCDRLVLRDGSRALTRPLIAQPESSPAERAELDRQLVSVLQLLAEPGGDRPAQPRANASPITVPVIAGGEVVGALRAERFRGAFDETSLALVTAVAAQIGAYLRLIHAERALRESERRIADAELRSPAAEQGRPEPRAPPAGEPQNELQVSEQRFFAEAGTLLFASLDQEEILSSICTLAIRELADGCVAYLAADGRVHRVVVRHARTDRAALAEALERVPLDATRPFLGKAAMDEGRAILVERVSPEYLAAHAQSEERLRALEQLAPTSLVALPLSAHGHTLGALVLLATRRGRRFGEADLRLAEELARRGALALSNAQLYDSAKRAIGARDEVLGVVAHDLRTPLTTIRIAGDALRRKLARAGFDEALPALDAIVRSTEHGERLIRDLIDLHRIEADKLSLQFEEIPTTAWMREILDDLEPIAEEASLELVVDLDDPPARVWGDRGRLAQVLQNLLGNAIKFTPEGGRIGVRARRVDDEALISVTDSGRGVAPAHLARIFDRFYRADPGDRRGAGLGLAISKGIVEAHGGRIWAESEVGHGASFHFTIPAAGERDAGP